MLWKVTTARASTQGDLTGLTYTMQVHRNGMYMKNRVKGFLWDIRRLQKLIFSVKRDQLYASENHNIIETGLGKLHFIWSEV